MARKIFISYRRDDSKHAVGRLHNAMKAHVEDPERDIFIDIDNIPTGVDFAEHLGERVAQCDVLFAVIGPIWMTVADPETGRPRIHSPDDFVRIEISQALKRGIPVVPVLLDDTMMPAVDALPDDLKPLVRRNGDRLQHESFNDDVARLIKRLPPDPAGKGKDGSRRNRLVGLGIATLVAAGLAAAAIFHFAPVPHGGVAPVVPPGAASQSQAGDSAQSPQPDPGNSSEQTAEGQRGSADTTLETLTNRTGSDYKILTQIKSADDCRKACIDDARCAAWTSVTGQFCALKSPAPAPQADNCCTSGLRLGDPPLPLSPANRTRPATPVDANGSTLEPATDRPGGDYSLITDGGGVEDCRTACLEDAQCVAWTFVRAGFVGQREFCALKNATPAPVPNKDCCTSGVRR